MSKITQALEKAARERLQRQREQATAPAEGVAIPVVPLAEPGEAPGLGVLQVDPHIVSLTDARSPIAEQYRILKTNLQSLTRPGHGAKAIAITSALHGEGKSVTAINLAMTIARQEQLRVLLVDADLRKSTVCQWLGMPIPTVGLSTVLANGGALNGSLARLGSPPVTLLPAGPVPEDPVGLLESVGWKRLMATLKSQFDLVLIDTPPVLAVADAGIVASQVDGVLFVVRAGRTQRRLIRQAQTRLQQMKADILGCVLTQLDHYASGYYRYYRHYKAEPTTARRGKASVPAATTP
jgi:capsular exopolysaccharide synthesis family protein